MKYALCSFAKLGGNYSYVVLDGVDVKEGDIAVVENDNTYGGAFGLAFVKVHKVTERDETDYSGEYKLLIATIDTSSINARKDQLKGFKTLIGRASRLATTTSIVRRLDEIAGEAGEMRDVVNELKELADKLGIKV